MNRTDIIQRYISKYNYSKYLEIGIDSGLNFNQIDINYKVGVDPNLASPATVYKTSDDYFSTLEEKFDLIFIDGMHVADVVIRDINNALNYLNDNGTIIVHDCLPIDESMQFPDQITPNWTGDVWKAWMYFRQQRSDLEMFVIDTDWGCGVIRKGKQKLVSSKKELNWNNFVVNKKTWMNIIDVDTFIKKLISVEAIS